MTARYTRGAPTICQWKVYLRGTFSAKNGIEKVKGGKNNISRVSTANE